MKRVTIIFSAVMILLVCITTVKAQGENQSANNSEVIIWNVWDNIQEQIGCTDETEITFNVRLHVLVKRSPNGTQTVFFNSHGEGIDADGGAWTWIDSWKRAWNMTTGEFIYENDSHTLQGPKGAKEKLRVLYVINGNGEVVQSKLEISCE